MSPRLVAVALALVLPWSGAAAGATFSGVETPVSTAVSDQIDPAISGDLVVFTDFRNGDSDIYYVDLATGLEHAAVVAPGDQYLTDVSNGLIVYTDFTTLQVNLLDTTAPAPQVPQALSGNSNFATDPAISQRLVVWTDERSGDSQIYGRNLDTSEERQISAAGGRTPAVNGGWIVWEQCPTGPCDIWAYNWATGTTRQITNTPTESEQRPDVWGNVVVYHAARALETDIFAYDLVTGVERRLSRPGVQINANVSGDFVAFDDDSEGVYHIKLWHLPTDAVIDVTSGSAQQYLNDIDGNRIVYTETRNGNADIYLYTFTLEEDPTQACRSQDLVASRRYSPSRWTDALRAFAPAMSFALPAEVPVTAGNAGDHSLLLGFGQGWSMVFCTYRGTAPGLKYALESCTDRALVAGATVTADRVWLHVVNGDSSAGETRVALTLAELAPCAGTGLPASCDEVGAATPLVDRVFERQTRGPALVTVPFFANPGPALVCVENGPAGKSSVTSGTLSLNRSTLVGPSQWAASLELAATLRSANLLSVRLAGKPGSAARVRIYGSPAQTRPVGHTSSGLEFGRYAYASEAGDPAMGCSQSGPGAVSLTLFLLVVLAFLPRPARVLVRNRRR